MFTFNAKGLTMPSWFNKVFKNSPPSASEPAGQPANWVNPILEDEDDRAVPELERRVVNAPIVAKTSDDPNGGGGEIRIKARVDGPGRCVFLVSRPVFEGHSLFAREGSGAAHCPLAASILAVDGVESVLIHNMTVTVERNPYTRDDWTEPAKKTGGLIRSHLESGQPVVSDEFLNALPSADEIKTRLERVLDMDINPGIASHSGMIRIDRVEGNTAYIEMLGGCQGCAASSVTLRQGVEQLFREAVPELGAILDVTDHASGTNPYYSALPAGME